MESRMVGKWIASLTCAAGVSLMVLSPVDAAEPATKASIQTVGFFRPAHRQSYMPANDARVNCEHENWRTKQWDESCWYGRVHAKTQAFSREKEAWHLYIRGAGPAIHERPTGNPCLF